MESEKLNFITHGFPDLLKDLQTDARGQWGKMNAQQMVEHVAGLFQISSGKVIVPVVTPEKELPKYKAFLYSDKAFRENTKAPSVILGDDPLPLRFGSMNEAIADLQKSIAAFVSFFKENPAKTTVQPAFGPLNFEEWILMHYKHVTHHARQFNLMETGK